MASKFRPAEIPGIGVLYMSGYTNGGSPTTASSGMLLEKPFTGDKLARAVREALGRPTAT